MESIVEGPGFKRALYLQQCKDRALAALEAGDILEAFYSMVSDLGKEECTKSAANLCTTLGVPLLLSGHLDTPQQMREWIVGFN
jgi:hypothetical protein